MPTRHIKVNKSKETMTEEKNSEEDTRKTSIETLDPGHYHPEKERIKSYDERELQELEDEEKSEERTKTPKENGKSDTSSDGFDKPVPAVEEFVQEPQQVGKLTRNLLKKFSLMKKTTSSYQRKSNYHGLEIRQMTKVIKKEQLDDYGVISRLRFKIGNWGPVAQISLHTIPIWESFKKTLRLFNPLEMIQSQIKNRFGSNVADFFTLWISIIWINLLMSVVMLVLLIIPWMITTNNWGAFIKDWSVLKGLISISNSPLGITFWYYGGYMPSQQIGSVSLPFDVLYSGAILAYFIVCYVYVIYRITRELRTTGDNISEEQLRYGSVYLGQFDMNITSKLAMNEQRKSIATQLLELRLEDDLKAQKALRPTFMQRFFKKYIWRIFGITGSIIVVLITFGAVGVMTAYYSSISTYATVIIAVINVIVPKILQLLVDLERYSNSLKATNQKIFRTYVVKMGITCCYVFRVLSTSLDSDATESDDALNGSCNNNELGRAFYQLILIDFAISALSSTIPNFIFYVIARARGQKGININIAQAVIGLFYRQTIIWIGSLVVPVLPLFGTFFNILLFMIKWLVLVFFGKFPDKPGLHVRGSMFYEVMLFITLLICLVPTGLWLQNTSNCGPFTENTPITAFFKYYTQLETDNAGNDFGSVLDVVQKVVLYTGTLFGVIVAFATLAWFLWNRKNMYKQNSKLLHMSASRERKKKRWLLRHISMLKPEIRDRIMENFVEWEVHVDEATNEMDHIIEIELERTHIQTFLDSIPTEIHEVQDPFGAAEVEENGEV